MSTRRKFLKDTVMAGLVTTSAFSSMPLSAEEKEWSVVETVLRFGIMADLHQDLIVDGPRRVAAFIQEMKAINPDFIIQIGDFCTPKPENQIIMNTWNTFPGPKYHVIGNHDIDGGFKHDEVIDFWKAQGKYYSFEHNGYHFVVLNGNERPPGDTTKAYPRSILEEQFKWLQHDLESTTLPIVIFCHQGIDNDLDGIKEGNMLRILFERINKEAGFRKIRLVLSGHHHEDYLNWYNDIPYLQINSIAYQFARNKKGYRFAHTQEPIWGVVNLLKDGTIQVEGKTAVYRNALTAEEKSTYTGYPTVPCISNRTIPYPGQNTIC